MIFLVQMLYWQLNDDFTLSIQHYVDVMLMREQGNDLMTFGILDLSMITLNVRCKTYIFSYLRNGKCVLKVLLFFDVLHVVKSIWREATTTSFCGLIRVVVDLRFLFRKFLFHTLNFLSRRSCRIIAFKIVLMYR